MPLERLYPSHDKKVRLRDSLDERKAIWNPLTLVRKILMSIDEKIVRESQAIEGREKRKQKPTLRTSRPKEPGLSKLALTRQIQIWETREYPE